jgi:hypothetical protein
MEALAQIAYAHGDAPVATPKMEEGASTQVTTK